MDKEREAFDKWYGIKPKGRFEAVRYDTAWRAWQAAKDDSHKQAALYQSEINHLAQANQQWHEKAAKAQAVPEGFVLVPKEPTKEMIHIGESTHYGYDNIDSKHCYIAMIEAAQEPDND